ncbi:spherical body protein, putative [Babesia ovis]|uniref:Spherical body protein, putative n=1 Tax=Babesia ovis TaxID=5869 RepID=A0A9W5WVY8_BABOV|nr:spherical body protein, putative [Babesia ovis]
MRLSGCVHLELTNDIHPPCMEIYEGSFHGGGKYRMFHSSPRIDKLTYLGMQISLELPNFTPEDIYIQEYKVGSLVVVEIDWCLGVGNRRLQSAHYCIHGEKLSKSTRALRNQLLNNHLVLSIDLKSRKVHPFIEVNYDFEQGLIIYTVMTHESDVTKKNSITEIRAKHINISISPILNIEDNHKPGDPLPFISLQSKKIYLPLQGDFIMSWLKHNTYATMYKFIIPPVKHGIFSPADFVTNKSLFTLTRPYVQNSKISELDVDISSKVSNDIRVAIMANIRRGAWFYTQYSVIPPTEDGYLHVNVINSKEKCEIYKANLLECITHVEIFQHVTHDWQYAIVNIDRYTLPYTRCQRPTKIQEAFKRIYDKDKTVYYNLNRFTKDVYINMLYNIEVHPKNNKQDSSEMETSST